MQLDAELRAAIVAVADLQLSWLEQVGLQTQRLASFNLNLPPEASVNP